MAKQNVREMLKRPVVQAAMLAEQPVMNSAMHEKFLSVLAQEAKVAAEEKMQPLIDAAMAKTIAAETQRDMAIIRMESEKSKCVSLESTIQSMNKTIVDLTDNLAKEGSAKDAANEACDLRTEKISSLEKQIAVQASQLVEINKHNAALQKSLNDITEVAKQRQPVKQVAPEFVFEVTARDRNGAIQTLSAKPK